MEITFSIIIPCKRPTPYLEECLEHIAKQSYTHFEAIVLTDTVKRRVSSKIKIIPTGNIGPALKRDRGVEISKGKIIAFIDDDAYPAKNWLMQALSNFQDKDIVAVGGPGITPPHVSWQEAASGWVSASFFGGGPYSYRFLPYRKRFVDDYPSMNLLIKKADLLAVGGFHSHYWPGEDTKLCLDLVYKLGKKIVYDPNVVVYHHRRVMRAFIRQNGNYGLHRGYFARVLPKTSCRLVYFIPSLFVLGLVTFPLVVVPPYALLLIANGVWIARKSRSLFQGAVSMPIVFLIHVWYGVRFLQGFLLTKQLRS